MIPSHLDVGTAEIRLAVRVGVGVDVWLVRHDLFADPHAHVEPISDGSKLSDQRLHDFFPAGMELEL